MKILKRLRAAFDQQSPAKRPRRTFGNASHRKLKPGATRINPGEPVLAQARDLIGRR